MERNIVIGLNKSNVTLTCVTAPTLVIRPLDASLSLKQLALFVQPVINVKLHLVILLPPMVLELVSTLLSTVLQSPMVVKPSLVLLQLEDVLFPTDKLVHQSTVNGPFGELGLLVLSHVEEVFPIPPDPRTSLNKTEEPVLVHPLNLLLVTPNVVLLTVS